MTTSHKHNLDFLQILHVSLSFSGFAFPRFLVVKPLPPLLSQTSILSLFSFSVCQCNSSYDGCELCCGVVGILLLLVSGGALLVILHISRFLKNRPDERTLLGERKGLRLNKFPIRIQGDTTTTLSHHRRRGNRHISHSGHRRHTIPRLRTTIRQNITPRKTITVLLLFLLTENVKGLRKIRTDTPSFHRFVLFFLTIFSLLFSTSSPTPSLTFSRQITSQPAA